MSHTAGIYSNDISPMFTITDDTARRHDLLLAPCSQAMFERLHGVTEPHPSCFQNLVEALEPLGIPPSAIPTTLNLFMDVTVDPDTSAITIRPPSCKAGDYVDPVAGMDLTVDLTSCSSEQTNAGSLSNIRAEVWPASP